MTTIPRERGSSTTRGCTTRYDDLENTTGSLFSSLVPYAQAFTAPPIDHSLQYTKTIGVGREWGGGGGGGELGFCLKMSCSPHSEKFKLNDMPASKLHN